MACSYIPGHEGISGIEADYAAAKNATPQGTIMPSIQNFSFRNILYQSILAKS
jgi:hypothetical protein